MNALHDLVLAGRLSSIRHGGSNKRHGQPQWLDSGTTNHKFSIEDIDILAVSM
jgi:hypothetical protein